MPFTATFSLVLALALTACAPDPERPPPKASTPIQSTPTDPQSVQIALGPRPPPTINAASPEAMAQVYPALADLPPEALLHAVGAMNLVPAPCPPCWQDRTLAMCALAPPVGCENLTGLVARATRLAHGGAEVEAIREALSYADVWFAPAAEHQDPDPRVVDIEVWVDPTAPSLEMTLARIDAVEAESPGPLRWHWRAMSSPSPSAEGEGDADRMRAERGERVARGLAQAAAQGKGRAWLEALQGVDAAAVQAASLAAGVEEGGEGGGLALEEMRTRDVRSSPTWFVEGYRLRGLQSPQEMLRVIALEQPPQPPERP